TPGGGLKGVYVSLSDGDIDSYQIELNPEGKELSRSRLERATAQFARMAAGPWTNGSAHVPGFATPAATLSEERAAAANPPPARPAAAGRSGPPQPSLQPNDWNTVQVIVETDMVSITLNGRPIPANAATN